jgi:hypothetical protein
MSLKSMFPPNASVQIFKKKQESDAPEHGSSELTTNLRFVNLRCGNQ